jgi:hypothetical protein
MIPIVLSVTLSGFVDGISKVLAETQSLGQTVLARYVMAMPRLSPRRYLDSPSLAQSQISRQRSASS